MENVAIHWSGGKDSALALRFLGRMSKLRPIKLISTVDSKLQRSSLHGISKELLIQQAMNLGLDISIYDYPEFKDNQSYEEMISKIVNDCKSEEIYTHIFGDIFLQDIIDYKSKLFESLGVKVIFPLKGKDTKFLSELFIEEGFKAVVTSIDTTKLDKDFLGCEYDSNFLDLTTGQIDPCGENGEFHTLLYDAPFFRDPLKIKAHNTYKLFDKFQVVGTDIQ